jgi:hypothetical protein
MVFTFKKQQSLRKEPYTKTKSLYQGIFKNLSNQGIVTYL